MIRSRSTSRRCLIIVALILLITALPIDNSPVGSLYTTVYPPPAGSGNAGDRAPAPAPAPPPAPAPAPAPPPAPGPYPGRGTNFAITRDDWNRAVTEAALSTSFDPASLVENERTRFTATIHYARPLDDGPRINVAYANDAMLSALDKQFDIMPVTDRRRTLDEGRPDEHGGLALEWAWDVTPRAVGMLTLQLEIQPVLYWQGNERSDFERRNKPIPINVDIHPNHAKFDSVVARSDKDFVLTAPNKMEADEPSTITASFVLHDAAPDVRMRLALSPADGSVPLTIVEKPPGPNPPPDSVFAEWEVTPGKEGDVRLKAAVIIATQSGDRPLTHSVEKPVTKVADAAPSFWGSIQGTIAGLTGLVALVAAVAGLAKIFPRPWRWVRKKLRLPAADPNPPTPPAP